MTTQLDHLKTPELLEVLILKHIHFTLPLMVKGRIGSRGRSCIVSKCFMRPTHTVEMFRHELNYVRVYYPSLMRCQAEATRGGAENRDLRV
jgi:hypothetical protein